jgi:translation initiation factor 1
MSRGKKLDIFVGADIEDGWAQVQTPRKTKLSNEILEPQKHLLFFKKEKRRGKTVTLVGEFQLHKEDITTLLKKLKKKLGCGGIYKEHFMEFQGELKEKLRELLIQDGFRFRNGH